MINILSMKMNSHVPRPPPPPKPPVLLCKDLQPTLTWVRVSRFDLDGRAAPAVLLHLGHPLASHLVGVVGGAHGDLVLDDALAFQLLAAAAANRRHSEPFKLQSSNSDCVQRGVALRRGAGPSRWLLDVLSQARYSPAGSHMWESQIS